MGENRAGVCAHNTCGRWRQREWAEGPVYYLVLQLGQEKGEQMLHGVVLAQDSGEAHDDGGQGRLHVLICV